MPRGLQTFCALIGGVAGYWAFSSSGWSLETKLAILLAIAIAAIGYPIGWLAGRYLASDADVDSNAFIAIAVIGSLGFIVPVVGMAISAVTWQFHKESEQYRSIYAWLSTLAFILAAGNAAYGAVLASAG